MGSISHCDLPFVSQSFPNKQKSAEPSPTMMSSSLGSNLSELDRLLLELNAVQHNPPGCPAGGAESLGRDLPAPRSAFSLEGLGLSVFLSPTPKMKPTQAPHCLGLLALTTASRRITACWASKPGP